jgi:indolepyruvate ferredoxin oxidoreductase
MLEQVNRATDRRRNICVDASRVAEALFGTHMAVNLFLLGVAWQAGLIPISSEAIERAIELNGVEVDRNRLVFLWGRNYYHDGESVERLIAPPPVKPSQTDLVHRRADELMAYQDHAYARQYLDFVTMVGQRAPALMETVARHLFKLMAYKDEYEVARLLTKPAFEDQVRAMWESPVSLTYNLHPPLLRRFGLRRKLKLGPWFRVPLRGLAAMKFLRRTKLDPFGRTAHRRSERMLPEWYRELTLRVIASLTPDNAAAAIEILSLPDQIRGYEKIKEASIQSVQKMAREQVEAFEARTRPVITVAAR